MPAEELFVNRALEEIPVLSDTWTTAWGCYAKIKDMNSLTKLTLETAESSVKTAVKMSAPVVTRYQPQINSLNSYACTKLDELEDKYPVVKLPSNEVKDAAMVYVEPMMSHVKPTVVLVQGMVDDSMRRVNSMKSQGTQFVVGARDLGVGTVTGAVQMSLASPPGRFATRTADGALTLAEGFLDKYMPEADLQKDDDSDSNSSIDSNTSSQPNDEVEEMEEMEPTPERVVVHFKTVSRKIRQRLFQRAMKDLKGAKVRTQEALNKLHGVVDLIDYSQINFAKENLGAARLKAEEMWQKITEENSESGSAQSASVFAGTLEERIISLGRVLTHQINTGMQTLETMAQSAGQIIQDPVTKSKEYQDLFVQFTTRESLVNFSKTSIESVRNNLKYVQSLVQEFVENVKTPEWMSAPIDMDDLNVKKGDILDTVGEALGHADSSEQELDNVQKEGAHAQQKSNNPINVAVKTLEIDHEQDKSVKAEKSETSHL